MPNRIYDNVIAVDSAMGNLPIVGGVSSSITQFSVIGFSFWAANTLGDCIFSGAVTTDWIVRFSYINAGSGNLKSTQSITFGTPLRISSLKCPTLTAGSGFVYLA